MRTKLPGQWRLLGAGLLMAVGGFLPWVYTHLGSVSGAVGGGLWVFYLSMLALAAFFLPPRLRLMALGQAVISGVVGVVLPLWQVFHVWNLVGFGGWLPGPGVVMSLFGGVLALIAAKQLWEVGPVR